MMNACRPEPGRVSLPPEGVPARMAKLRTTCAAHLRGVVPRLTGSRCTVAWYSLARYLLWSEGRIVASCSTRGTLTVKRCLASPWDRQFLQ